MRNVGTHGLRLALGLLALAVLALALDGSATGRVANAEVTDLQIIGCELLAPGVDGDLSDPIEPQDYAVCSEAVTPAIVTNLDTAFGNGDDALQAIELEEIAAFDVNQISESCTTPQAGCTLLAFAYVDDEAAVTIDAPALMVTLEGGAIDFTCDENGVAFGQDNDCSDANPNDGDGVVAFHLLVTSFADSGDVLTVNVEQENVEASAEINVTGDPHDLTLSLLKGSVLPFVTNQESVNCLSMMTASEAATSLGSDVARVTIVDVHGEPLARQSAVITSDDPDLAGIGTGSGAPVWSTLDVSTGLIAQRVPVCAGVELGDTVISATIAGQTAMAPLGICGPTIDGDCIPTDIDNCPFVGNPGQANFDALPWPTAGYPSDLTVPMSDMLGDACDVDDDNDGVPDTAELTGGCWLGAALSGPIDPFDADNDRDGVIDGAECALGYNPNSHLSKPPAIWPGETDNDGLSDAFEALIGSNPNSPDSDGDGIGDGLEFRGYGTSPARVDSDSDGCADDKEVASINGDYVVNAMDLALVAQNFGQIETPRFDLTRDGTINALDLVMVAANFAPVPCGP